MEQVLLPSIKNPAVQAVQVLESEQVVQSGSVVEQAAQVFDPSMKNPLLQEVHVVASVQSRQSGKAVEQAAQVFPVA